MKPIVKLDFDVSGFFCGEKREYKFRHTPQESFILISLPQVNKAN